MWRDPPLRVMAGALRSLLSRFCRWFIAPGARDGNARVVATLGPAIPAGAMDCALGPTERVIRALGPRVILGSSSNWLAAGRVLGA